MRRFYYGRVGTCLAFALLASGSRGHAQDDDALEQSFLVARELASSSSQLIRQGKPCSVLKGTGEARLQWPKGQVYQDPPAWYVVVCNIFVPFNRAG